MSIRKFSLPRYGSATAVALALSLLPAAGWAEHRLVKAADLKWSAVPSLPAGAQLAVIEGPMNQAVPFTVRIRFPANYRLPAHTHPAVERVTVLSGTFHMGMGRSSTKGRRMPCGPATS